MDSNSSLFSPKIHNIDQIDLIVFFTIIWSKKRKIFIITASCGLIGIFLAIISPIEYKASMVMVPQTSNQQSKLGNFSSLIGLAGINLNTFTNSDINPKLFPQILSSPAFILELMNSPLRFKEIDQPITFYDYYVKIKKPNPIIKYTIGLPRIILDAFRKDPSEKTNSDKEIIEMTENQVKIENILSHKVSITLNDDDGSITISGNMPEPLAAALLVKAAQNLLQRQIIQFKIEKTKATLDFIQQRWDEAKTNLQKTQKKRADFQDQNLNISSAKAKIEEEWLNAESTLSMNIFSELSKQLEQSRIQLKEETPVFTIIKPIKVPTEKSQPRTILFLIVSLFLGLIMGTTLIFWKVYWVNIKDDQSITNYSGSSRI